MIKKALALSLLFLAGTSPASARITSLLTLPAGNRGDIQFNNGNFGSDPTLTFSTTTKTLTARSVAASTLTVSGLATFSTSTTTFNSGVLFNSSVTLSGFTPGLPLFVSTNGTIGTFGTLTGGATSYIHNGISAQTATFYVTSATVGGTFTASTVLADAVGIGTTTPTSSALHVFNGSSNAQTITETSNSGAAAVFALKNADGTTHEIGIETASDSGGGRYVGGAGTLNISAASAKSTVFSAGGTQTGLIDASGNTTIQGYLKLGTANSYIIGDPSNGVRINNSGDTINVLVAANDGWVTQPNQPSFLVTDNAGQANVTGDGTDYVVNWNTEVYDQNSDFVASTFTAPVSGQYYFATCIDAINLATTHTGRLIYLKTSNRNYFFSRDQSAADAYTEMSLCLAVTADMDANDTAVLHFIVSGGAKTADLSSGNGVNYFSGTLIN